MKTIVAQLGGGIGNQMFQYTFARTLAKLNNADLKIEAITYFKDYGAAFPSSLIWENFNIFVERIGPKYLKKFNNSSFWQKIGLEPKWHILEELNFDKFQKDAIRIYDQNIFIKAGFWQNERYFNSISDIIRNDFSFINTYLDKYQEDIIKKNSVAIHVRRGDYLSAEYAGRYIDLTSTNYYDNALSYIKANVENPFFFIFSDDLDWCKQKFSSAGNVVYIENTEGAAHELFLMSLCKNQIIANSTYGWWGAWLNKNENKIVVCPTKWFANNWEDGHYTLDGWINF
jgi:hypothetical protein